MASCRKTCRIASQQLWFRIEVRIIIYKQSAVSCFCNREKLLVQDLRDAKDEVPNEPSPSTPCSGDGREGSFDIYSGSSRYMCSFQVHTWVRYKNRQSADRLSGSPQRYFLSAHSQIFSVPDHCWASTMPNQAPQTEQYQ